jgi:hypothetical protein
LADRTSLAFAWRPPGKNLALRLATYEEGKRWYRPTPLKKRVRVRVASGTSMG